MCINLETSLVSFIIGEYYGWKLFNSKIKEYKILGVFIMFFTLIQLIEACIYFFDSKWYKILNKILVIFLGLQGFVIFYTHQKILNQNHFLYMVSLLISIIIICKSINDKFII